MLRLTDAGRAQADQLLRGDRVTTQTGQFARRLLDAGLAHPRPSAPASPRTVTTIIPVRDRPLQLEECLRAIGNAGPVIVVDDGSRDAAVIAAVCERRGAELLRLEPSRGPAAARNAGLRRASSELVAFVDSDAVPEQGWLEALGRHFADADVGAAAPRIRPVGARGHSALARYAEARSPLDLGASEALVAPHGRVPYVPTAALLVRREALAHTTFDQELRFGEDVDLVWRLIDAGWRVRYDPSVCVRHHEPGTWLAFLARRYRYGRSAAPLSTRHPGRIVHVVIAPLPAAAAILATTRRSSAALLPVALQALILSRHLSAIGIPRNQSLRLTATSIGGAINALSQAATVFAAPLLALGLLQQRTRRPAALLLTAAPIRDYLALRPRMTPATWLAARAADEAAYGTGVLQGCLGERTSAPLRPRWRWHAPSRSAEAAATARRAPRTPPDGGD
jgi:mycofactocin system glycosyltransferase